MKNKIVVFKVLAAIIAVVGAFASVSANSSLVATSAYVRYTTADTNAVYCAFAGVCESTGTSLCIARVQIGSDPVTTTQARATLPPSNNTCPTAILVNNTSGSAVNSNPIILPDDAEIK